MRREREILGIRWRILLLTLLSACILVLAVHRAVQPNTSPKPRAHLPPVKEPAQAVAAVPVGADFHRGNAMVDGSAGPSVSTALRQHLSDPEASVRLAAIQHLGESELAEFEAIPILTASLNDRDARIRAYAALKLGSYSLAASDAVPALKQLARDDSDDLVRSRAKDALYNIRLYDYSPLMQTFEVK